MVMVAFVVKRGVVPIRVIVGVGVVLLPACILVMRERHALSARDRGQALDRNGQGQQEHGKKAEETFRHRGHCNASCFERDPRQGFRPAYSRPV